MAAPEAVQHVANAFRAECLPTSSDARRQGNEHRAQLWAIVATAQAIKTGTDGLPPKYVRARSDLPRHHCKARSYFATPFATSQAVHNVADLLVSQLLAAIGEPQSQRVEDAMKSGTVNTSVEAEEGHAEMLRAHRLFHARDSPRKQLLYRAKRVPAPGLQPIARTTNSAGRPHLVGGAQLLEDVLALVRKQHRFSEPLFRDAEKNAAEVFRRQVLPRQVPRLEVLQAAMQRRLRAWRRRQWWQRRPAERSTRLAASASPVQFA
mmetsp:Transcript_112846/g.319176  ORF Transcript_112846/g.319176 Transcript_112846/m.319176 type:complete len:264 (-) Transcript_112846:100-891(-)